MLYGNLNRCRRYRRRCWWQCDFYGPAPTTPHLITHAHICTHICYFVCWRPAVLYSTLVRSLISAFCLSGIMKESEKNNNNIRLVYVPNTIENGYKSERQCGIEPSNNNTIFLPICLHTVNSVETGCVPTVGRIIILMRADLHRPVISAIRRGLKEVENKCTHETNGRAAHATADWRSEHASNLTTWHECIWVTGAFN